MDVFTTTIAQLYDLGLYVMYFNLSIFTETADWESLKIFQPRVEERHFHADLQNDKKKTSICNVTAGRKFNTRHGRKIPFRITIIISGTDKIEQ